MLIHYIPYCLPKIVIENHINKEAYLLGRLLCFYFASSSACDAEELGSAIEPTPS